MRLLTILCLVLLSVHSYSQEVVTGPFLIRNGITYYQDTNEPITGIVEKFSDNSLLQSRANYRDGEVVVQTIFNYFENGQLEFRENWIDGVRSGLFEWFYENGQLDVRGNYRNGVRDGLYESFHENGQLQYRGNYTDGVQDGLVEFFDEDGNLTETRTYRNGVLVEENRNP